MALLFIKKSFPNNPKDSAIALQQIYYQNAIKIFEIAATRPEDVLENKLHVLPYERIGTLAEAIPTKPVRHLILFILHILPDQAYPVPLWR